MRLQPLAHAVAAPDTCGCRCDLIREADDAAFPRYALYVTLGRAMCAHPPPKAEQLQVLDRTLALTLCPNPIPTPEPEPNPNQVLNDVWTEIAKLSRTKDYVLVAMQYLRFLLLATRGCCSCTVLHSAAAVRSCSTRRRCCVISPTSAHLDEVACSCLTTHAHTHTES